MCGKILFVKIVLFNKFTMKVLFGTVINIRGHGIVYKIIGDVGVVNGLKGGLHLTGAGRCRDSVK